jgi:hypothetical protein
MNTDEKGVTNGELIDSMSILDIISHPHFLKLEVFHAINNTGQSYWEITLESNEVGVNGLPLTIFGKEIPQKRYMFFKEKK